MAKESFTDLDTWLQSPCQLDMLAEAPVSLPTDSSKLIAEWRREQAEDENHVTFCMRHCCWGIPCLGIPWIFLPYNLHRRCKANQQNADMFSKLGKDVRMKIDNKAVTIKYKAPVKSEVPTFPAFMPLGPVAHEVTDSTDKVFQVPLMTIADVHLGFYRQVNAFDPVEGFSWWTGYYSLLEHASGPLHLVPVKPEQTGPFPDGFTVITQGPVTMTEKCCEGEMVGCEGEPLFKLFRVNHDIVFPANVAKTKKAIMLAVQMKKSEAWDRFWGRPLDASGRLSLDRTGPLSLDRTGPLSLHGTAPLALNRTGPLQLDNTLT